jgi:hypothetical protein
MWWCDENTDIRGDKSLNIKTRSVGDFLEMFKTFFMGFHRNQKWNYIILYLKKSKP